MSARKSFANRKFYSLPENPNRVSKNKLSGGCKKREESVKLVKYIDDNLIGKNATFIGPYGRRKVVYCDYAVSGRSLHFIEDYILREVLPSCGTANSTTNITSLQSVLFRQEAEEIFRLCVNASDDDVIIFSGLCPRDPIERLVEELGLKEKEPPVVFVGSCDRISAILPWKNLGAKVVRISESKEGFLDLNDLENQLMAHRNRGGQLVGCFSVANNVTGILADDVATTLLLHQYGALALWDYATAAPYVQLDMNPTLPGVEESAVRKDAMFFSCHKFIGGNQTPGVIVAKKYLFRNSEPFDSSLLEENERQVVDLDVRGDRSTATVVADVRAGLVMHLKEAVGVPAIMSREEKITRMVFAHAKNIPEMILLGNSCHSLKRLPFFSFIVRHPRGMFLHHNFVCSVLNDVFGIQARGSCADADRHSIDFMGIDRKLAEKYGKILQGRNNIGSSDDGKEEEELEILRPGFVKISLPFCISDAELGFVLEALKMVATEGWKLLPQYTLKANTAEWRHHGNCIFKDRKWLGSLKYVDGRLVVPERKISSQGTCPVDYEECLHVARCIFNKARKIAQRHPMMAQKFSFDPEAEPLRWFMLPTEGHDLLIGNSQNVRHKIPFDPNRYRGCKGDPLREVAKGVGDDKSVEANGKRNWTNDLVEDDKKVFHGKRSETKKDIVGFARLADSQQSAFRHDVSSERLNSFSSSEISSSDCLESPTSHNSPQLWSTSRPSYGINSNYDSPPRNPCEVFCPSPQPPTPSPVTNQMDAYARQFYHPNHCAPSSNFYSNQCSNWLEPIRIGCGNDRSTSNSNNYVMDSQLPVNRVHFLLGRDEITGRQRCNSLGSSLVPHHRNRGNSACGWRSLIDGDASLNLSECSLSSNEDIHAYVAEVTKELATEIKSEIREVISKVEDVLSESADSEGTVHNVTEHRGSRCTDLKSLERTYSLPSASANDIAQYLMGVSKEMAEEMKSEIRELVNSVVSSDSPPNAADKREKRVTIEARFEGGKDKGKKNEVEILSNESISQSRDSGINMSYSETGNGIDAKSKGKQISSGKTKMEERKESVISKRGRSRSLDSFRESGRRARCRSESLDSLRENEECDVARGKSSKKSELCFPGGKRSNDDGNEAKGRLEPRWCCPSKAVWKPAVEAVEEFEMIQNGDRVLVVLSGGKNSWPMLHTLQQYKFYASSKGLDYVLGAVTFGPCRPNLNGKPLTVHLERLGIPHHSVEGMTMADDGGCSVCRKTKRGQLYAIARENNYNVIAVGQDLDDLAETFLLSAFHDGKLAPLKAHYHVPDEGIRTIRPFVYVRKKALRRFSEDKNLPDLPEICPSCAATSKERQSIRRLLLHQESTFPRLFSSLRAALRPMIGSEHSDEERGKSDKYVTDSDET